MLQIDFFRLNWRTLSLSSLSLLLAMGCASIDRSSESGYGDTPAKGPHIISNKKAMTDEDTKDRLRELEKGLTSRREQEQYSKVLPLLKDDEEKVELLSIPTIEGKQKWITSKNLWARSQVNNTDLKKIMESQDIALGMNMDFVKKSWGEPLAVEVSGNPHFKNERWKYQRFAPSPEGYKKETRFVYFEGGKVVGWETE